MPLLTSVLKRTTIMVLVIIVALTGSEVTPEYVNCINKKEKNSVAPPSYATSVIGCGITMEGISIINNARLQ